MHRIKLLPISQLALAAATALGAASTSPEKYSVARDEKAGVLSMRTPFYRFEHDLRRGGVLKGIALENGKASNLITSPMVSQITTEEGWVLSDLNDPAPEIRHQRNGPNEVVTIESVLRSSDKASPAVHVKTTYEYRWGYVRIRKEISAREDLRLRELAVLSTTLAPTLTDYGYREGLTEQDGAPAFSFGSNRWGKMRPGNSGERPLQTRHIPRSMLFADPGVEGLEWFVGSDLWQWDLQVADARGKGKWQLAPGEQVTGNRLVIAPFSSTNSTVSLSKQMVFDFYLGVPILEGRAQRPWLHTSFNRNRGNWVSASQITQWAEQGIQTAHCHNDGDYYDDGLFWRDGSYPPYPDMNRYDEALRNYRKAGIRTATYFSNKELHPSTREFKEHGSEWGRKNRKGALQHNIFRGTNEFGAQMCLRSGWLDFLKFSIDRVLKNHPLDGVYYDWNVALVCSNPLHEGHTNAQATAHGHWDMDELMDLMEWTRKRVGPDGLVIIHNTTTPMFATENFADHIVATEWGYKKWTDRAASLEELPLEWSLVGARSRGVISYGTLDANAPSYLHRAFAIGALLGGVATWPADAETFKLSPVLKPLGDPEKYRFTDWRNGATKVSTPRAGCAVYSRPNEAYLLIGNLDNALKEVTLALDPGKLPFPIARPKEARIAAANPAMDNPTLIQIEELLGSGAKLSLPPNGALLLHVR